MSINTHLQKIEAIKKIEDELAFNENDKLNLIIEVRSAYNEFGPEFGARVRELINEIADDKEFGANLKKSQERTKYFPITKTP